jgi:hypothetical protein
MLLGISTTDFMILEVLLHKGPARGQSCQMVCWSLQTSGTVAGGLLNSSSCHLERLTPS